MDESTEHAAEPAADPYKRPSRYIPVAKRQAMAAAKAATQAAEDAKQRMLDAKVERAEAPRPKPPAQRTVRVRLLKAYWPGDGREHPDAANRLSGRKHRFDAGEILDLPVEEARKLLDEYVEKRTVRVWDAKMRRWVDQDDSLHRPPVAVRANAYSVEED